LLHRAKNRLRTNLARAGREISFHAAAS
jgi:hypothetical protein